MIYIRLETSSYQKYLAALTRMYNAFSVESEKLCRYGAIDYKNLVSQAIATNSFPTRVPRHTKKYAEWKRLKGKTSRIGILDYDLLHAITAFKTADGWFGGVPPGVMDDGGKNWNLRGRPVEIVKYGMWLEEGNRLGQPDRQRPRPIFMPLAKRYIKLGFMVRVYTLIRKLETMWR